MTFDSLRVLLASSPCDAIYRRMQAQLCTKFAYPTWLLGCDLFRRDDGVANHVARLHCRRTRKGDNRCNARSKHECFYSKGPSCVLQGFRLPQARQVNAVLCSLRDLWYETRWREPGAERGRPRATANGSSSALDVSDDVGSRQPHTLTLLRMHARSFRGFAAACATL